MTISNSISKFENSKSKDSQFSKCVNCDQVYLEEHADTQQCPQSPVEIDALGRQISSHSSDKNFKMAEFIQYLKKHQVSWRRIFWKLWARTIFYDCRECGLRFCAAEYQNCSFHPLLPALFLLGSNSGKFNCCNKDTLRFGTKSEIIPGCQM